MINVHQKDSDTVELELTGEITGEDYKTIRPKLEAIFAKNGKQKFLFNMLKVKSFTLGGILQDIKFDLQHLKYIGTTAVVSTKAMASQFTAVANMLYPPAKIEHFEETAQAINWLHAQAA